MTRPTYRTGRPQRGDPRLERGTCEACGALVFDRDQHNYFHALLADLAKQVGTVDLTATLLRHP